MLVTGKRKDKIAEPEETPAPLPSSAKEEDVKIRYILPAIKDAEESNCAIRTDDGRFLNITVKGGIYEIPDDEKRDETIRLLEANGWKFLDKIDEKGDESPDLVEKVPARDYAKLIRLAHPDLTDDNKPEGLMTYDVDGQSVDITLKAGIGETKNPALVRVLVSKGFAVMNPHTLETEEEKLK